MNQEKAFAALSLALLLTVVHTRAQTIPQELVSYPETIFHNGVVLTVDTDEGDFTVAEAIAIRDGKILAVGSDDRILRLAGPATRKVDLEQKTLMPGIIDTHVHPNRTAIRNYFDDLAPEHQRMVRAIGSIASTEWEDKADALESIRGLVEGADPRAEWLLINGGGRPVSDVGASITRFDLDEISPDRPLFYHARVWEGFVNTKALEPLLELYGDDLPGVLKDENGVPTGQLRLHPTFILRVEIMPRIPPAAMAPLFAKELLEHLVRQGKTTFSSRLNADEIRAYQLLDLRGELPMRLAYGHEMGRWNPIFERDLKRNLSTVIGHGTDMVWMNSVTVAPPDGSLTGAGDMCSTYSKRELRDFDTFPDGRCRWDVPGDMTRDIVRHLIREGFRIANIHTEGDKGNLMVVDLYAEEGVDPGRRFGLDHTVLFNEDLIRKSGELGIYWSMSPGKLRGTGPAVAQVYGLEIAHRWTSPFRELLDAGAKVTYEGGDPFADMELFVTRRLDREGPLEGTIFGARHAVDRETVLRMMTRWGAEYVMRDDVLGTIEPGKYADVIVVDRNPLDPAIPDDRLSELKVLMTIVGGKVVYDWDRDGPPPTSDRPW